MQYAATQAYARARVETATPAQLIGRLYEVALRSMATADVALARGDRASASADLRKAQDIVSELRCCLDLEVGDIARNLDAIYHYIGEQLVWAKIRGDRELLAECIALLRPIRDAWAEAVIGEVSVNTD
ncbi:MAG: flagellar export chaperone FliS [Actinomycetota bacterium]|nr:flagellar export chaperone FliS [Actinomycetota bacterium]